MVSRDVSLDLIERVKHHHIDNREPGNEFVAELGIFERFGSNELQLDTPGPELISGVKLHAADRVDIGALLQGRVPGPRYRAEVHQIEVV